MLTIIQPFANFLFFPIFSEALVDRFQTCVQLLHFIETGDLVIRRDYHKHWIPTIQCHYIDSI